LVIRIKGGLQGLPLFFGLMGKKIILPNLIVLFSALFKNATKFIAETRAQTKK
jgi:hypothetical protein